MTRQTRIVLIVIAVLVIVALAAAAILLLVQDRPPPPSSNGSAEIERLRESAGPEVAAEMECIDRIVREGVPEGQDPAEALARCRPAGAEPPLPADALEPGNAARDVPAPERP